MEEARPKTRSELQEQRKLQLRKLGGDFIDRYIKTHPHMLEISHPLAAPQPSSLPLYIPNPEIHSKSELNSYRKQKALFENEQTLNFNCKTLSQRVEERERLISHRPPNSAFNSRASDKRAEDIASYEAKFAKRPLGVHGEELPKFSENLQEYWRLKQGYNENPIIKSKERPPSRPISEFTRLKVKSSSINHDITAKPTEINPFPNYIPDINYQPGLRSSSRPHTDERWALSRPSSQISSLQDLSEAKPNIRPSTAIEKNVKPKNVRPFTANTQNKKIIQKNMVRSSGFFLN